MELKNEIRGSDSRKIPGHEDRPVTLIAVALEAAKVETSFWHTWQAPSSYFLCWWRRN